MHNTHELSAVTNDAISDRRQRELSNTSTTTAPMRISISASRIPYTRIVRNFRLVWLDGIIDDTNDTDSIGRFRQVVNNVKTFTDVEEYLAFITHIHDEKIFLICSGELAPSTVPVVHEMIQINCIYIYFVRNNKYHTNTGCANGLRVKVFIRMLYLSVKH